MAKAIKFNLIIDSKPIRSLEDLQDNFNIEDILDAYKKGLLNRWLETRDLKAQMSALEKISGDDIETALELCRVLLGTKCTKEQLEAAVYPYAYKEKEKEQLQQYKNLKEQKEDVIRAYHETYDKILKELEDNGDNYSLIKSCVAEMFKNYFGLYRLDANNFYEFFIKHNPLVILTMLAYTDIRPHIAKCPEEIYKELDIKALTLKRYKKSDIDAVIKAWQKGKIKLDFKEITTPLECAKLNKQSMPILINDNKTNPDLEGKIINSKELEWKNQPITYNLVADKLTPVNHVRCYAGKTDEFWKDIEQKGKQFLIIKMEDGNKIRNYGKKGEELNAKDVNSKFVVLDGIDYKSNRDEDQLVYMEV
jgi:hypothetical protein